MGDTGGPYTLGQLAEALGAVLAGDAERGMGGGGGGGELGEHSAVYPNAVIREGVRISRRVIIHPGAVLGADGFGYAFDGSAHQKIPQVGGVIVEDDVEIGANVTIARGTPGGPA